MSPRFSIILPAYNVAPYLKETLESISSQTFTDFECICVDDGSTDQSLEILENFSARDSRFRVFHQENSGVASARNFGLQEARGEWISFLDGDDLFSASTLSHFNELILSFPKCDMVGGALVNFTLEPRWGEERYSVEISEKKFPCDFPQGFYQFAYSSELVKNLRFQQYIMGEDVLFLLTAQVASRAVALSSRAVYGYRARIGSVTRAPKSQKFVRDFFLSHVECLEICCLNRERFTNEKIRQEAISISENTLWQYRQLPKALQEKGFTRECRRAYRKFARAELSFYYRTIFSICGFLPFDFLLDVLMVLPFALKRAISQLLGACRFFAFSRNYEITK